MGRQVQQHHALTTSDTALTNPAKPNKGTLEYIQIQGTDARRFIPALVPPLVPTRLDP